MPLWAWFALITFLEAIISLILILGFFILMEKYGERIFIKLRILKKDPRD